MQRSQRKPILYRGAVLGAALLLALVGCGGGAIEPVETAPVEPPAEDEPEAPAEPELLGTWPLTGIEIWSLPSGENGEGAGSLGTVEPWEAPVLSVKIENSAGARPQDGLERADLVWEQLVEGGMTRFVAMFHSDIPETVGPIRSVRAMDAAIVGPVGGVLAFSGGQPQYRERIRQTGVVMVEDDAGSAGFYRNPERRGAHSLFGYPEQLLRGGGDQDGPDNYFSFATGDLIASAVADGTPANGVAVTFPASKPAWDWNGSEWERSETGSPALAYTGARLVADNVIVAMVQIRDTGLRDAAGSMVPETILSGSGKATVFSGGHALEVTWEKGNPTEPMMLHTLEGEPVLLTPGNTWIELLPATNGKMRIASGSASGSG